MAEIELGDLDTDEYRAATWHRECGGCRGAFSPPDHSQPMRDWYDKPHRLVLDLCTEVDRLRVELVRVGARQAIGALAEERRRRPRSTVDLGE